jgi:hypothetical protein
MQACAGLITQEARRLNINLSRANTLQGLTLVHISTQPETFSSPAYPTESDYVEPKSEECKPLVTLVHTFGST